MKNLRFVVSALLLLAALAFPAQAWPIGSVPKRGGLSIALNTSGWQFTVTDNPTLVAQTFSAEVILRNDSTTDATFTFSDSVKASNKFTFSILDADGAEVWQSDTDGVALAVMLDRTLAARSRWSRALSIPLTPNGTALAPGIYTLAARLATTGGIAATTAFQVNAVPVITTGISGQIVLPAGYTFTDGTRVSILVTSEVIYTTNSLRSAIPRPFFKWTGTVDAAGQFTAPTPPGNYTVLATATKGASPDPGHLIPLYLLFVGSGMTTATVTEGELTPVTLTLHKPWIDPIIFTPNVGHR